MSDDARFEPFDPEMVEFFRAALMREHSDDWTMEVVSEAAHVCASAVAARSLMVKGAGSTLATELRRIAADDTATEPGQTWRAVSVKLLGRCAEAMDAAAGVLGPSIFTGQLVTLRAIAAEPATPSPEADRAIDEPAWFCPETNEACSARACAVVNGCQRGVVPACPAAPSSSGEAQRVEERVTEAERLLRAIATAPGICGLDYNTSRGWMVAKDRWLNGVNPKTGERFGSTPVWPTPAASGEAQDPPEADDEADRTWSLADLGTSIDARRIVYRHLLTVPGMNLDAEIARERVRLATPAGGEGTDHQ